MANGTDDHSAVDVPIFCDPFEGDFRVKMNDTIRATGFRNFAIDHFGVIFRRLKATARQPEFPMPVGKIDGGKGGRMIKWDGALLKEVEGFNEQSAMGLEEAEGVYILKLSTDAPAYRKDFRINDVITMVEDIRIYRDQKSRQLSINMEE